jgi:hypothetical protein
MTLYYRQVRALIDPEQSDPLAGGGRQQDVSVILTDPPARPVAVTMSACETRELAFELLELAEHADRMRTRR